MSENAIVLDNVQKHFRKRSLRKEHTTIKSELVKLFTGKRKLVEPDQWIEALKGVDLKIPRGATVGIIGRNGSGKSTLLKVITGIYTPTAGSVTVNGRISALLELGAGFHPDFTGRENILINGIILGMSRAEVKARMDAIIDFAELGDFIDERVRTYSSGMFMRLAFAVATHVDPEVLIIDEILSVGDEHFGRKSMAKMGEFKQSGRTIILVTHGLETVESWCDLAVWIDGGVARMVGDSREVVRAYREAVSAAESEAARTGHSALSMPGQALPQLAAQAALEAPARIVAVRHQDASGVAQQPYPSGARIDVLLDYVVRVPGTYEFTVDVLSSDSRLLFTTRHQTAHLEVSQGTARLSVPRLGLGEGTYTAQARVGTAGDGAPVIARSVFSIGPQVGVWGLVAPQVSWSLEPSPPAVS